MMTPPASLVWDQNTRTKEAVVGRQGRAGFSLLDDWGMTLLARDGLSWKRMNRDWEAIWVTF